MRCYYPSNHVHLSIHNAFKPNEPGHNGLQGYGLTIISYAQCV